MALRWMFVSRGILGFRYFFVAELLVTIPSYVYFSDGYLVRNKGAEVLFYIEEKWPCPNYALLQLAINDNTWTFGGAVLISTSCTN